MNKTRQQELTRWLRQQRAYGGRWLRLTSLFGLASALAIIAQAWLLAFLLQALIVEQRPRGDLQLPFALLLLCFALRALLNYAREAAGFRAGQAIRQALRQQVLDRLSALGPAWIRGKPAGSWATLLLEQIEEMQEYYARYLPQMTLAALIPLCILLTLFPLNWAAGLILLVTAPLIPLFMALVGMGAADANRRNFVALARLSGDFLDRLRGRETLRLFHRAEAETAAIAVSTSDFRQRTMEVLRLAFLSSAVLEFFASLAIAVVAVYFGFSYLGELHFGTWGSGVTLFAGFVALILAPEFFQPLRDLGVFYHAKAQAVGGADALERFMRESPQPAAADEGAAELPDDAALTLVAQDLIPLSAEGKKLCGPFDFTLAAGERVALVGQSGAGKTVLMNVLLGFLPYQGSLRVNGVELREMSRAYWQRQIAWLGQNPQLPAGTLQENIVMGNRRDEIDLHALLSDCGVSEFLPRLSAGLQTPVGDDGAGLSVGQAQRIALARTLYKPARLLLLDEPAASLDSRSEQHVMRALDSASRRQTTLMITHQLDALQQWDAVWVMQDGRLVQQGCWRELAAEPGPFRQMVSHRQKEIC
ncbi:cysteine/glutathione ABC transporter permease/ATP-binding protein CydD [Pantoea sp. ACRSH]|uniref:heme ABC transporter permease/ATP-binding protein CydD n=1 Tax=unclassified Pantoea TaxID=2630326 RepID=UPI001EF403F8|nr:MULTISPECIES: cysteine/glutathione ABC transporter permease/ATP-binding protein CydD [unclassified Pantoea]MCG7364790.1 cysteine/glutathione ABC transporter permease/ATP-binding protein CydD [Pantoea sp. ACRSH]MCG7395334.1 cysteine/glutathione ABC transporter permease/ATP-binding protein CydD [Pantoea sp. ACRSC]